MDLQTATLVAFAIYAEADAGIVGKTPSDLNNAWRALYSCETAERVLEALPIDLHWKWENYWSIWSADLDTPAPEPESDQVEITEKGIETTNEPPAEPAITPIEKAKDSFAAGVKPKDPYKARSITLTPKGEAAAQAAELEIHAESEARNLEGSQPAATKRRPKKG